MIKVLRGTFGIVVNVVIYAAIILIVYKAGAFAYDFSYQVFGSPVVSEYSTDPVECCGGIRRRHIGCGSGSGRQGTDRVTDSLFYPAQKPGC